MVVYNLSWFIVATIFSAFFIYGYETYLMAPLTQWLFGASIEAIQNLPNNDQNALVPVLDYIITGALIVTKGFVALFGIVIANGLSRKSYKASIGPGE